MTAAPDKPSDVPPRHRRRDSLLPCAVIGFALCLIGFCHIESRLNQDFADFAAGNRWPILGVLAGLALFVLGSLGLRAALNPVPEAASRRPAVARVGGRRALALRVGAGVALAAGAVLLWYTVYCAMHSPRGLGQGMTLILAVILLPVGAALLEATRRRRGWFCDFGFGRFQDGLPIWRRDAPWLALLLVLWIAGNQISLDTRPGFFHGDESMLVQYGRITYLFPKDEAIHNAPVWMSLFQPFLSGIPRSLMRDLFPDRPYYGARLFTLLVAAATIGLTFLLARGAFGRMSAWFAALLMAGSHVFMAFSRMALNNMDALFLVTGVALCLLAGWRSRRASLGLVAGLLAGLGIYTYQGALLAMPLLALLLAVQGIRDPRALARRWAMLLGVAVGIVIAAAPMVAHHRQDPSALKYRTSAVSILTRENLAVQFKVTGTESLPALILHMAWPALGGVLLWPDASSNYEYARAEPMATRDTAALIALGLAGCFALWRRRRAMMLLLAWVGLGAAIGSLLSISPAPPYAPRLLILIPAVAILCGWVLGGLVSRVGRVLPCAGRWILVAVMVVWVGFIGWRNVDYYHVRYRNDLSNPFYGWVPIGFMDWMRGFHREDHLVLIAPSGVQMFTSAMELYDTGFPRTIVMEPDQPIPPPSESAPRTAYAVHADFLTTYGEQVAKMFPNVTPIEVMNPYRPEAPPSYRVWMVDKGTVPAAAP